MGYVYFEMLVYCDINFFGWDDLWWRRRGRERDLPYCAWLNYTMPPEWLEPPYPLSSGFSTQSAQPVPGKPRPDWRCSASSLEILSVQ